MKKKTLKEAIEIEGIGLHTAKHTTVKIKPQDTGGIKFKRTDFEPKDVIWKRTNVPDCINTVQQ